MKPIVIVNLKTDEQSSGQNALKLAKICEKVVKEHDADIRVAVQAVDLRMIAEAVSIPVYAQHIDPITPGQNTGWTSPDALKEAGAVGTLLNHSEHRLRIDDLQESVKRAKELGLIVVICANDAEMVAEVSALKPDFIAVEPPELIGNPEISISTGKPELISDSYEKIKETNIGLIAGAGVKDSNDVKVGLKLGAVGVLPASGVDKSPDPESVLKDLCLTEH